MTVATIDDPADRSRICGDVLRELPGWFGLAEANARYVQEVSGLPTFAVGGDAFLAVKQHTAKAAEVYVMGVRPELHGRGLGSALLEAAEEHLRGQGVEYLQVKTLGPSRPSGRYERTRGFYEARGFVALEEISGICDADNPCLILVKRL